MGNVQQVQQSLEVVRVDTERNLILVKGSIPGPKGFDVIVQSAEKASSSADLAWASITVTGIDSPSSVNTRLIPIFRPTKPSDIIKPFYMLININTF